MRRVLFAHCRGQRAQCAGYTLYSICMRMLGLLYAVHADVLATLVRHVTGALEAVERIVVHLADCVQPSKELQESLVGFVSDALSNSMAHGVRSMSIVTRTLSVLEVCKQR